MNELLVNYIRRYVEMDNREIELFETYLSSNSYKKKEYILREGKLANHDTSS